MSVSVCVYVCIAISYHVAYMLITLDNPQVLKYNVYF